MNCTTAAPQPSWVLFPASAPAPDLETFLLVEFQNISMVLVKHIWGVFGGSLVGHRLRRSRRARLGLEGQSAPVVEIRLFYWGVHGDWSVCFAGGTRGGGQCVRQELFATYRGREDQDEQGSGGIGLRAVVSP